MKKKILIGITGGIAAFKVIDLVRQLKKSRHDVLVIMTRSAWSMVSPKDFKKLGVSVYSELFEEGFDYRENLKERRVEHIDVADSASVMVIAPATANVIAKLAHGIADDYLTTVALAATCPIILCPSMNVNMWQNPIVQKNIQTLRLQGFIIIEPDSGLLACGYEGKGRLVDIKKIKDAIENMLAYSKSLSGKCVIITAGGTQEKIDDVRYITNRSSGKMGVALAEECYLRGADVLLFRAENSVMPRYLIKEQTFTTAQDLRKLIDYHVGQYDIVFHTAAVSDFSVKNSTHGKIKSDQELSLELEPQTKILTEIKKINPTIFLVGFKAEFAKSEKELIAKAKLKLKESDANAIVANDVAKTDRGFGADTNEVLIVFADGRVQKVSLNTKRNIAKEIVEAVTRVKGKELRVKGGA